ncbi:MAG: hypothetical protein Q9223_007728, partial [Gallowayella weberi]
RKRSLEDDQFGNSSDTPLFSSDDHPASFENYQEPYRKRQRKGPWWVLQNGETSPVRTKGKREFTRNIDSGVWMGSDQDPDLEDEPILSSCTQDIRCLASPVPCMAKPSQSDDSQSNACSTLQKGDYLSPEVDTIPDDSISEPELYAMTSASTFKDPEIFDGPMFPFWDTQPSSLKAFWRNQKAAVEVIQNCIDCGLEIVDLSNFALEKLQESTLQPLQYLIRQSLLPYIEWFDSLKPDIQLFLAYNSLSRLPGQLFRLHNLTVLSLRNNNLTELPSAIGSLVNLRELNVGSNRLQWLPYEIQRLLRKELKIFGCHPNPFVQPVSSSESSGFPVPHPLSTRPAFFRNDGALARGSPPSPLTISAYRSDLDVPTATERRFSEDASKVPSLFEVSLRVCYDLAELGQLPLQVPREAPESLTSALKCTWKLKQEGGQRCTICKSSYIIPRTEWIEWWPLSGSVGVVPDPESFPPSDGTPQDAPFSASCTSAMASSLVPFLRRGCSWLCVPDRKSSGTSVGWISATDVVPDVQGQQHFVSPVEI